MPPNRKTEYVEREDWERFDTRPLLTGRTEVETSTRSAGDIPIGGIIEWDDTFSNIPEGFVECDGSTISDPTSPYNGSAVPNLNTEYYSVPATEFKALNPDVDDITYSISSSQIATVGAGIYLQAPVNLPHGATVTACVVYGSDTGESWTLTHSLITSGGSQTNMATAAIDTADTSITDGTIDNSTKVYNLETSEFGAADIVNAALITYTPRNKFIIRIK